MSRLNNYQSPTTYEAEEQKQQKTNPNIAIVEEKSTPTEPEEPFKPAQKQPLPHKEQKRACKVRLKMGKRINRISVVNESAAVEESHYKSVKSLQQRRS